MKYSLRSLFVVVTLAGVLSFFGYLFTRDFFVYERLDCGKGRFVELLDPNEWCDNGGPRHFRFSGMRSTGPPSFVMCACSDRPKTVVIYVEGGDLVGLARESSRDEIEIMIDFKTGQFWPESWHRKIDDNARAMLARLRRNKPQIWLRITYDGELEKPSVSAGTAP